MDWVLRIRGGWKMKEKDSKVHREVKREVKNVRQEVENFRFLQDRKNEIDVEMLKCKINKRHGKYF